MNGDLTANAGTPAGQRGGGGGGGGRGGGGFGLRAGQSVSVVGGSFDLNGFNQTLTALAGGGGGGRGGKVQYTGDTAPENLIVSGAGTILQNSSAGGTLILHSNAPSAYQNLAMLNGGVQLDAERDAKSFKPSDILQSSVATKDGNGNLAPYGLEAGKSGPGVATLNSSGKGFAGTLTVNAGTLGTRAQSDDTKVVQLQFANPTDVSPLINDLFKKQPGQNQGQAVREFAQADQTNQPFGQATTQPTATSVVAPVVAPSVRHVIRSGTMEFEVDNYDSAFLTISKITAEEGGFVEAADSDKLPNGKVRGNVTVRVPPDNLDTLVMKLRALGDLKSQKLGSTDIGKEYTDLESQLRAARAMEERLIDMIKKANGKVADLLEAEKELGNWRTKIETIQGQLNYYNNLVSMATLTISAYEKDIRTPASASEMEEINAGIETEDVEAARAAAIKSIDDVKGRIVESSLQKLEAGQFAAKIVAEVSPADAGPLVDRLKQLGRVARLDIQRKQTDANAQGTRSLGPAKVEQAPTRLIISMYNLANVAPRLTTNLNLAGEDVESEYRAILKRVADANGRVISSNLNRQDATQVVGAMQFEVKAADADAVLNDIRTGANVLRYSVNENPDTANVTTAKQAFVVQIIPLAQVPPRLTTNLNLAASDVESSYRAILKRVTDAGGRVISSNLNRADATQAVGNIQFELKSEQADAVRNDITKGVQVLQLSVAENPDSANVTTAKQVFVVQIIPTSQVAPRETRTLSVETSEVETAMQNLTSAVAQAGGRTLESNLSQDANGRTVAQLSVEVPLDKADALIDVAKGQGKVRTAESSKNTQVPDGPLARARLNLTIGTGETIVAAADGFWPRLRGGLSTSVNGLLWSFELIVIGLCLVGPWALLIWGGWRFLRSKRSSSTVV
jgi:glycine cleavage system regulatory protein